MFWYEDEIKRLEQPGHNNHGNPYTIFYGSSTIRLWDTLETDLQSSNPINLGFGGSTLAACVWFFDRIMKPYAPQKLVVYAGDNDLGDGRHPEEIFIFFQQLAARAGRCFGDISFYYISLKPSISRWHLADQFRFTNSIIANEITENLPGWQFIDVFNPMLNADGYPERSLFMDDGLHLSAKGYELWTAILQKHLGGDS